MELVLPPEPKNNEPRELSWRVSADVGEANVEGDKDEVLSKHGRGDCLISGPAEAFLKRR